MENYFEFYLAVKRAKLSEVFESIYSGGDGSIVFNMIIEDDVIHLTVRGSDSCYKRLSVLPPGTLNSLEHFLDDEASYEEENASLTEPPIEWTSTTTDGTTIKF